MKLHFRTENCSINFFSTNCEHPWAGSEPHARCGEYGKKVFRKSKDVLVLADETVKYKVWIMYTPLHFAWLIRDYAEIWYSNVSKREALADPSVQQRSQGIAISSRFSDVRCDQYFEHRSFLTSAVEENVPYSYYRDWRHHRNCLEKRSVWSKDCWTSYCRIYLDIN